MSRHDGEDGAEAGVDMAVIIAAPRGPGQFGAGGGGFGQGPGVAGETVNVEAQLSGFERADRIADARPRWRRGAGFEDAVEDAAPTRADGQAEIGAGPAELAVMAGAHGPGLSPRRQALVQQAVYLRKLRALPRTSRFSRARRRSSA